MKRKSKPKSVAKSASGQEMTSPPVVVVMGHVDHGKTTLLEAIRDYSRKEKTSSLTAKEHGGITQHTGAYQVIFKGKPITFLDTPGHEAFAKMRSRGAQVADLAVLVVAANDGVKPQTKEAISHIKEAKIPFLVAINKMDLPQASLEMVKAQLAEEDILVEGYGGNIVAVPVSAKKSEGIAQLLEMILLVAEMEELKAKAANPLKGYVVESFLDPHCGVLANVLVKDGQLKLGDRIKASIAKNKSEKAVQAKVKALIDENGKKISKVKPGQSVQILGFKKMPLVGAEVALLDEKEEPSFAKASEGGPSSAKASEGGPSSAKASEGGPSSAKASEGGPSSAKASEDKERLKLILKTDVAGTLEAIKANLTEEVELVGEGVGDITESDILLADSTGAQLIGFNVRTSTTAKKLAEMEKVKIKIYTVIYQLLEDIQKQILELIEPTINEEILGEAEVIAEFNIKDSHIAGCKVKSGRIGKTDKIRVKRGEEVLGEPRVASFQKERKEVEKVKKGDEVGIVFKPDIPFKLEDVIISYKIVEE